MRVKIRTLKQDKYEVEVEPTYTIEKLKEIIEEKHKFDKTTQTLIYAGKILTNEKTIQECNLRNDDFLVLMIKKATAAGNPPAKGQEKPAEFSVASTTSSEKPQTSTSTTETTDEKKASETLLTGNELEAAIQRIVDMGFSREQVVAALKVSFNNPERAVEYLMSGFPQTQESLSSLPPRPAPSSGSPASQHGPVRTPQAQAQAQSSGVFDGLRQHPQFAQLCLLAQQGGEEALKQILQYFAQTNRPLLDLIMQNQDEFIRLLNTPVRGGPSMGPQSAGPGVIRVHVTPEDEAIINNLVGMGFERNRVLEAYFLFEKDETMTANYLLNNPEGDGGGNFGSQ